jgi:hypothetical protein
MDVAAIERKLREHAGGRWVGVGVELALGIPLSLVGPVVMTGLIWFTVLSGFQRGISLWLLFGICVLVMVPLEYWTEMRSRGNFLEEAIGGGRATASGVGGQLFLDFASMMCMSNTSMYYTYYGRGADPAGIVELMLWGPRQVLSAIHNWRLMRRFREIDLGREGRILLCLMSASTGVKIDQLMLPKETRANLVPSIAYLAYYDWVGVAEAGDKVWLLSEGRERLMGARTGN